MFLGLACNRQRHEPELSRYSLSLNGPCIVDKHSSVIFITISLMNRHTPRLWHQPAHLVVMTEPLVDAGGPRVVSDIHRSLFVSEVYRCSSSVAAPLSRQPFNGL